MFLTLFQEAQPMGGFCCLLGWDMAGHSYCPPTPSLLAGSVSRNICPRDHCQDQACFVNQHTVQKQGGMWPSPGPRRHWADHVPRPLRCGFTLSACFLFCFIHSPFHSLLPPFIRLSLSYPFLIVPCCVYEGLGFGSLPKKLPATLPWWGEWI